MQQLLAAQPFLLQLRHYTTSLFVSFCCLLSFVVYFHKFIDATTNGNTFRQHPISSESDRFCLVVVFVNVINRVAVNSRNVVNKLRFVYFIIQCVVIRHLFFLFACCKACYR